MSRALCVCIVHYIFHFYFIYYCSTEPTNEVTNTSPYMEKHNDKIANLYNLFAKFRGGAHASSAPSRSATVLHHTSCIPINVIILTLSVALELTYVKVRGTERRVIALERHGDTCCSEHQGVGPDENYVPPQMGALVTYHYLL